MSSSGCVVSICNTLIARAHAGVKSPIIFWKIRVGCHPHKSLLSLLGSSRCALRNLPASSMQNVKALCLTRRPE